MPLDCAGFCVLSSGGRRGSREGRCRTLVSQGLAQVGCPARDDLKGHGSAPPPPACWDRAAAARDRCWVLIYKKGDPLNRLRFLEPKRQVLSADRQDQSGDRQKPLALLSVLCQGRDSQPTTSEGQNDGRSTEPGVSGEQHDYHQAGLSRVPHEPQRSEERRVGKE